LEGSPGPFWEGFSGEGCIPDGGSPPVERVFKVLGRGYGRNALFNPFLAPVEPVIATAAVSPVIAVAGSDVVAPSAIHRVVAWCNGIAS
jgi:hypothetical protein